MAVPLSPGRRAQRMRSIIGLLAAAALPCGAIAHHSFDPLFDADGEEAIGVIDGSVRVFRILNPHGALVVDVTGASGDTTPWLIELSPATQLAREGWTDDMVDPEARVTVAVGLSRTPNRGRLRALLVHADRDGEPATLLVSYGIRGDTPVMRRLRERLPACGAIDSSHGRTECFLIDAAALRALEAEFPGRMGYVMPGDD